MKLTSLSPEHRVAQRMYGMTLVELMVSCGVGVMVLLLVGIIFISGLCSFADMGSYMVMDQASRNALDQMTRDIRRATNNLSFFSTNRLEFGTNLSYNWYPASGALVEWRSGSPKTNLTGCDFLQFTMYKHIPLAGGTNATTTVLTEAKAISVAWKCSRTRFGNKVTTEDMQQGLIVIRNKTVN